MAQIISPAPGSRLPAGAVTFAWCNASADYFLTIESPRGAANIYDAFVAVGESVTIGPGCNTPSPTNPTTECIPASGATIYVTLWTNTAQSGRKNYVAAPTVTYVAPGGEPAAGAVPDDVSALLERLEPGLAAKTAGQGAGAGLR